MSHVKSGHLTASGEWRKHLRPWYKRAFWKHHRNVETVAAKRDSGSTVRGRLNGTRLNKDELE